MPRQRLRLRSVETLGGAVYLKRGEPHCLACDYCLSGLKERGRCPECGGRYVLGDDWTRARVRPGLVGQLRGFLLGRFVATVDTFPAWRVVSLPLTYGYAMLIVGVGLFVAWLWAR